MKTITIKDEVISGEIINHILLQFDKEYVTVRELISARIKEEVSKYENDKQSYTSGLVLPTNLEKRLNNTAKHQIDVEKQIYVALNAFKNNGFFVLVDDEQVEKLDDKILVDESTTVSFLKLTPLVGG